MKMTRPTFPPKPPAPSAKQRLAPAIERSRRLSRRLKPDETPRSRSELVEEIGRKLPLPPTLLDLMRERAKEQDGD